MDGILISQCPYMFEIFDQPIWLAVTPMDTNVKESLEDGAHVTLLAIPSIFCSVDGALQYLAFT